MPDEELERIVDDNLAKIKKIDDLCKEYDQTKESELAELKRKNDSLASRVKELEGSAGSYNGLPKKEEPESKKSLLSRLGNLFGKYIGNPFKNNPTAEKKYPYPNPVQTQIDESESKKYLQNSSVLKDILVPVGVGVVLLSATLFSYYLGNRRPPSRSPSTPTYINEDNNTGSSNNPNSLNNNPGSSRGLNLPSNISIPDHVFDEAQWAVRLKVSRSEYGTISSSQHILFRNAEVNGEPQFQYYSYSANNRQGGWRKCDDWTSLSSAEYCGALAEVKELTKIRK
jgi:hypothetical protein